MATPADRLAQSLGALKTLQDTKAVAIRASDLTRVHRERLLAVPSENQHRVYSILTKKP